MRSVFFGSPEFAAQILTQLVEAQVEICAVVTQPPRPKGRSKLPQLTPVGSVAKERLPDVPLLMPERLSEVTETLISLRPELLLVAAYGGILGRRLLHLPTCACLNVHPSVLPKYRGAAPIQHTLFNGETESGVCIMHLAEELDAGDVMLCETLSIGPEVYAASLEKRLCALGAQLLLKAIALLEAGNDVRIPQDPRLATFAPKITPPDCRLSFERPASELHNRIRALSPYPGAFCFFSTNDRQQRLKILSSRAVAGEGPPGTFVTDGVAQPVVACGESALQLLQVQPEGRPVMAAVDFLRGLPRRPHLT